METEAKYTYDSWGQILSITNKTGNDISSQKEHIGNINPYRYRSYRYDTETKMYYLQSRYYNPEIGRFINADGYGGQVGKELSHNLFMYCNNNSINMFDPTGYFGITVFNGIKYGIAIITVIIMLNSAEPAESPDISFPEIKWPKVKSKPVTMGRILPFPNQTTKTGTTVVPLPKNPPKQGPPSSAYREASFMNKDVIIGKRIDINEAAMRVNSNLNVMCDNNNAAVDLLIIIGQDINHLNYHPRHGTDYYNHYHLNWKSGNPHIWFLGEQM